MFTSAVLMPTATPAVADSRLQVKTLAKKWLKTPHNRFKMRRKCEIQDKQRIISDGDQSPEKVSKFTNRSQIMNQLGRKKANRINTNWTLNILKIVANINLKRMLLIIFVVFVLQLAPQKVDTAPQLASQKESNQISSSGGTRSGVNITRPATIAPKVNTTTTMVATTKTTTQRINSPTSSPANHSSVALPHSLPEVVTKNRSKGLEEEVSLVSLSGAGSGNELSVRRRHRAQPQQPKPAQMIRIQATLNGKLTAPIRIENASSLGPNARQSIEIEGEETTVQWQPVTTSLSSPQIVGSIPITGSSLSPTNNGEPCQHQQQQSAVTPTITSLDTKQPSIATTSQVLRLTTAKNNNRATNLTKQHLSFGVAHSDSAQPLARIAAKESRAGELDSAAGSQTIELTPKASSSARTATIAHQQVASTLRVGSGESLLNSASIDSGQRQVASGDSILGLIDDYDSKIITNRTKGKQSREIQIAAALHY